ncbi:hypothetical protein [Inquilinus limosus]|uniref:Uncharacterized protein n=1 Tax=Inquilinus limosus TaxID=171674 RepID=A0A211ZUZ2_9PROT|nr:hypothetical protein [Inquilinus limosus]OWJ69085.1 hypothetical protein BWR60_00655 [Inquilinus limosus]
MTQRFLSLSWLAVATLILPGVAQADGERLEKTFLSICVDTFPDFAALGAKVTALGGWLDPKSETISRVPFVLPDVAWGGSTGARDRREIGDMGIDRAEGTVSGLPAAGCAITGRGSIDNTAMAQLVGHFEPVLYIGEHESPLMGDRTRSWWVQVNGQGAVLAITQPRWGGEIIATSIALVRLDKVLIDELKPTDTAP